MPIITVQGLCKSFSVTQKEPGLAGSIKTLVRPKRKTVEAVKGISFELPKGELLAFIGPNGAGKSTTIKMLTGILYPTGGEARVMGFTPWKDQKKIACRIGSVFGQKPQLWYHLPPGDTFSLFARIYEIEKGIFKKRLAFLVEAFDIGDIVTTPVRKLSLGQRMKCEIVASLLHGPEIIFLDEPTIGLDVVAKQQIRAILKGLHEKEGTTIFLTSHDAGDIESLCKRVIIINHGQVIYDNRVSALKRRYFNRKIINVRFAEALEEGFNVEGADVLKTSGYGAKISFMTDVTPVEKVIQRLMNERTVADITIVDPPLEEIIRSIYEAPPQERGVEGDDRKDLP
ncbi:MAG: ATP-binding cassette domain-containing protein [Candidatus Eremiobacteraeota bacterium]|nr:ATP-binding cassette domain-containing protein [Candidatus Eremiobacteraeota bacterium]